MDSTLMKIIVILLIFLGESLAIGAEMFAARTHSVESKPFLNVFLKMFLVIIVGGAFLIAGYMLGLGAFKSIWIVSVASITSILIMEPVIAYLVFQQLPARGAIIGFVLGMLGFLATLFL